MPTSSRRRTTASSQAKPACATTCPKPICWPANVDINLIREREKVIYGKLRIQFKKQYDYVADSDGRLHFTKKSGRGTLTEKDQELIRTKVAELIDSDPVLNKLPNLAAAKQMHAAVLFQRMLDELFGFGPLGPLLRCASILDIWVSRPDVIFVERCHLRNRTGHFEEAGVCFESEEHLMRTISKILEPVLGHSLSEESPSARAVMPSGAWVLAALPPPDRDLLRYQGPMLIIRQPDPF